MLLLQLHNSLMTYTPPHFKLKFSDCTLNFKTICVNISFQTDFILRTYVQLSPRITWLGASEDTL